MKESLTKKIFLNSINTEIDINKRQNSLNKDLFSLKMGNTFFSKPSIDKAKLPPIRKALLNDTRRNRLNKYPSFEQTDEIVNIINRLNKPLAKRREKSWYTDVNYINENNKVMTRTQNSIINDFTNEKYFKKEIKDVLNTRVNSQEKKKENLFNKVSESFYMKTLENSNKKNLFGAMTKFNNNKSKIKIQPINIRELFKNRSKINKNFNKNNNEEVRKLRFKRNKIQNKSNDVLGNPVSIFNIEQQIMKYHQNLNKEDKNSIIFLTNFYEDFIELYSQYDSQLNYISIINNFNRTYFFLFEIKSFPRTQMNKLFLQTYKYSCILDICLVFISKDEELYNVDTAKVKDLLRNFIFLCLNTINYKKLESKKVNDFMSEIKYINQDKKTFVDILESMFILLFNGKANDYKKIRKCLKQLLSNINEDTPEKVLSITNECILFCQNCSYYYEDDDDDDDYKKKKKKKKKNKPGETENQSLNSNLIEAPFIKKATDKKFSLVIDLDETLIHNLSLPFGPYFLVRPGVFELFETINKIYEIVIFTASSKRYANSIIKKIDYKNNVDYILHKKYIIYEEGNPVKRLDMIGRDINKIIFVDNLEINAKYNKKNLYLISSWYNNVYDDEIYKLKEKLMKIANSENYKNDITKGLIEK
jgi:hypothetical protein